MSDRLKNFPHFFFCGCHGRDRSDHCLAAGRKPLGMAHVYR